PELKSLGREIPQFSGPFPRRTTMELAKEYGDDWEIPASLASKTPFWALSHKREFYDAEDPDRPGYYLNYDLIYPEGFGEALSGAEREYDYGRIMMRINRDRLDKSRYEAYLKLAEGGMSPSAGGGFGIERLVRYLSGAKHIGEVQLFKRVPGTPVIA
ncbi:MAG TPA: asparagine synthetase, partial [Candidatus Micrarchaeota archaeon]|nr:asparagine synthetase [Candidatus Micrarchaeota archaeon]